MLLELDFPWIFRIIMLSQSYAIHRIRNNDVHVCDEKGFY